MMRAWRAGFGFLALLCLTAGAVHGQSLQVRGGEHASFTRIVVALPVGQTWRFGRSPGGYALRFDDSPATFDTTVAFDRIPRTRLADLAARVGGLDLRVTCECHAVAFEDGGGRLVMDIRDGPAPRSSRFEQPLEAAAPRPAFDWLAGFDLPTVPEPAQASLPDRPAPDQDLTATQPPIRPGEAAHDLLVRQLARAGAQGLLGNQLALPPAPLAMPPAGMNPLANLSVRAETAVDRARRADRPVALQPDGSPCLPDALFDLAAWGDGRPATEQLSEQRSRLVGEFDRVNPDAVHDLARLYLHFGFGAEARELLDTLATDLPDAAVLGGIAAALDDPFAAGDLPFSGMEGCDGAVALWAMLAAPAEVAARADGAAIGRAFSALPPALRHHLGPPLVQRFRALDDPETALQVRNAVERAPGVPGGGSALIEAELSMAAGRPRRAEAALEPLVVANLPVAPEALALQVEARMAAGASLDPETVRHLAAMAAEHRGTPVGLRLARLHAKGLAAEGLFDTAFAIRDELAAQDAAGAESLTVALFVALAEDADELTFLSRMLSRDGWRGGRLPRETRRVAAERFLAAGFPDLVADALASPERDAEPETLLRVRAALDLGDPRQALRQIAGAEGAKAARLRGAALLALGDAPAAFAAATSAEAPEQALRALWQAGDWAGLAEHAQGTAGRLAAQVVATAEGGDGPMTPAAPTTGAGETGAGETGAGEPVGELARARALLTSGEETRALVAALLSERPAP